MADYDLGTAHGKIVVEYKDTGTGKAGQDLDTLRAKAKALLTQFQDTSSKYVKNVRSMATEGGGLFSKLSAAQQNLGERANQLSDDITRLARTFGILSGAVAIVTPLVTRTSSSVGQLRGASQIVKSFRLALGDVPKGAEGFPNVIKKIIQVSAAVALFHTSTSLIAQVTSRFRLLGAVGGLVGKFGGTVNSLAGPLHAVAGIAGQVAFQILQFKFVKAVIKPLLLFGSALGGVGLALHVVSGLVVSIKELLGIVGLLPAGLGVAALAVGTLVIGLHGFGDAMKALGKGDTAKFEEAISKLAPSAQEAARAIRDMYPAFKALQLDVQQKLFGGMGDTIRDLGRTYLPILQKALGDTAIQFNAAINGIADFFRVFDGDTQVPDDVAQGFDFLNQTIHNLLSTLPNLVPAFYIIGRVGAEVLAEITGGAQSASERFRDFIFEARATGKLKAWIEGGVQAFKDLWGIIRNVGAALGGIWKGLSGGQAKSFLATLRDMTARFNEFVRSAQGQRILGFLGGQLDKLATNAQKLGDAFLTYVLPVLEKFAPIMMQLSSGAIDGVVRGLQILNPIFMALGSILGPIAPLLGLIFTGMVTTAVVLAGLGVAAKITGGAFLILKSGMGTIKAVAGVAGFAARLLTGNLKSGELQAIKFAGALLKKLIPALFSARAAMLLLKWGAIAVAIDAAVGAIQGYSDEQNKAFANQGFTDDVKTFWDEFKKEPFQAIGKEFRASLTPPPSAGADFKRIGDSFQHDFLDVFSGAGKRIGDSFMTDFVGFFTGLPGKISGLLSGVGTSFETDLVTPIQGAIGRVKDSFMTDFVGFFTGLGSTIGGALTSLGTTLYTAATNAWESFKTGSEAKFNEIAGTTGSLPFRIGHALGALIGMAATWAVQTWQAFLTGTQTKANEIIAEVSTWPTRFTTWISGLAATLATGAVNAWNSFWNSSSTTLDAFIGWLSGLPGRIGAAISGLVSTLSTWASNAWNSFYQTSISIAGQVIGWAAGLPGRVGSAIAGLVSTLASSARNAWNSFYQATVSVGQQAISWAAGLPGRMLSALGNLGSYLFNAGKSLIQGFINGIKSMIGAVADAARGLVAGVRAYFPFSPAKKGPFSGRGYTSYSGKALIADFARGMASNRGLIESAASAAMGAARLSGSLNLSGATGLVATTGGALPTARPITASGADGAAAPTNNTFHVTIAAKDIAEMKNVSDFFAAVTQKARAGRATI